MKATQTPRIKPLPAPCLSDRAFRIYCPKSSVPINAPTNNYRIKEKKIRIRNKRGDFYGTDIWLIPK